jgi:RNA recognition motif-containing protein
MKIHIGNLSPQTKNDDLKKAFEAYGPVTRVNVVADKETGEPRGFAFVEMTSGDDANNAILGLHEQQMHGNTITVREARTKKDPNRPQA